MSAKVVLGGNSIPELFLLAHYAASGRPLTIVIRLEVRH
jgi:hypothetical protein